jgi:hypothetical protein
MAVSGALVEFLDLFMIVLNRNAPDGPYVHSVEEINIILNLEMAHQSYARLFSVPLENML